MNYLIKRLRLFKRIAELCYRIENFWHWRGKGLPLSLAWKKSDLTL